MFDIDRIDACLRFAGLPGISEAVYDRDPPFEKPASKLVRGLRRLEAHYGFNYNRDTPMVGRRIAAVEELQLLISITDDAPDRDLLA